MCKLLVLISILLITSSTKNIHAQNSVSILKKFAAYNLWANTQLADWMQGATQQQFTQDVESSFSSLKKTIAHIWNAEYGWLQFLKEKNWTSPNNDFEMAEISDFLKNFVDHSALLSNYVNELDEKGFEKIYTMSDSSTTSAQDIILHIFNHSTFHRGQIITIARQVGLKNAPRTDFIYYSKLKNK